MNILDLINLDQPIVAKAQNPRKLFIFGQPKVGKTELALKLPNSYLIDLEDAAHFYGGKFFNVKNWAKNKNIDTLSAMRELIMGLNESKRINNNVAVYDYLIIDSATELEDMAKDLAAQMYKATPQGKSWTGVDITTLPNGAGEIIIARTTLIAGISLSCDY